MKRIGKFQAFLVRFIYGARKKGIFFPIITSVVESWVIKKFNFLLGSKICPDDLYENRGMDVVGSCDKIAYYDLKFLAQDLNEVFEMAQRQIGMSSMKAELIKTAKGIFWDAHLLAKSIGVPVHKSWKQYLTEN
jgi:hypothetical protein